MIGPLAAVAALGAGAWYWRERGLRRTHAMAGGLHADRALPHDVEFELYHNDFSLCSKKIRMCLAELGIPYASHHVDLIETGSYETLSRRFLAVNPAALVPVLVHDGHPVYESHDILLYAARHAAAPGALVPPDEPTRAVMQQWIDRSSLTGDDPTQAFEASAGNCVAGLTVPLFAAMIRDIPTRRILEGLLFHRLKQRPLVFLLLKAKGLAGVPSLLPVRKTVLASRRHMERHLDALAQQLAQSGGPWITGAQLTLADVSWAVILERLREADWVAELIVPRPAVAAYWERLRGRPSYASAMDDHQHPLVRRGSERIVAEKARGTSFAALYAATRA
ncbi:MAG: glutathione S-transferase family protein [Deltaproteobacteria bacterium]|nr:glutathione S-transferase family protein [Deltaproteobacteria bacterium]